MKNAIRQTGIAIFSLTITGILVYLSLLTPFFLLGSNGPPPFDIAKSGIYLSHPLVQGLGLLCVLLAPWVGSFVSFLLHKKRKGITVFVPVIFFYSFYLLSLCYIYFVLIPSA